MKRLGLLIVVWGLCVPVYFCTHAAPVSMSDLPYFCGFEDDTENSQWVLNQSAPTDNLWLVGTADAYDGSHAMYISSNATAAVYNPSSANIVLAYRELQLEKGDYDFAFDWKGQGNGDEGYVRVLITSQNGSDLYCRSGSGEPAFLQNSKSFSIMGENVVRLSGEEEWQHIQTKFSISATWENVQHPTRNLSLLIEWLNTAKTNPTPSSIMLDNIQLSKSPESEWPQNAHVDYLQGYSNLYWEAFEADKYEVRYRKLSDSGQTGAWEEGETANSVFSKYQMEFGAYEFWMRGIVGADTTIYYYIKPLYVYETDCFDALNMYGATYETGTWNARTGKSPSGYEKVDWGYASEKSRHTTHYMQDEYDVRTIGTKDKNGNPISLKTVPEGAFGSVRLGNWETSSQYESITFNYTVPGNMGSILLIQYAMVLQETGDHPEQDQPRLTIDILNAAGEPIDIKCGTVDFHTPTKAEKQDDPQYMSLWYENKEKGNWWQDWRAVGLNLDDWIDSTLTIIITSYDCDQGGHYGYCYFTLNCISSEMEGIPWGEDSSTNVFTAPNGFNYEWYKEGEPENILSTDYKFEVNENDTTNYFCRIIYASNSECDYLMEATARPHTPKAEIQWEWVPENCQNGIIVRNASHVQLHNQITGEIEDRYDMKLMTALWELPDGTQTDQLNYDGWYIPCSNEGETFVYSLHASNWVRGKEYADSVRNVTINVPAIDKVDTYLADTMICELQDGSQSFLWADSLYKNIAVGNYSMVDTLKTWTGCDSIVHQLLNVTAIRDSVLYDTICAGGSYRFGGMEINRAGNDYIATFTSEQTGCDSIVHLHLAALPEFAVSLHSALICADEDAFVLKVSNSEYADKIRVYIPAIGEDYEFEADQPDMELAIPLNGIPSGNMEAEVAIVTPWCDPQMSYVPFVVNLPKSIVKAKWDNVLAILNENYNGGFRFSSYQWYCNDKAIEGATGSWIHADGLNDATNEYYVEVKLEDGTPLIICPFVFDMVVPDNSDASAKRVKKVLENQRLYIETDDIRYDIFGRKVRRNN